MKMLGHYHPDIYKHNPREPEYKETNFFLRKLIQGDPSRGRISTFDISEMGTVPIAEYKKYLTHIFSSYILRPFKIFPREKEKKLTPHQ